MSLLRAAGVRRRAGGRMIVDGIDLAAEAGSLTALVGPNGAGKSTLMRILAGDLPPTAGAVHLAGRPLAGSRPAELARMRAALPQRFSLDFGFRVREVAALGRFPHRGGTRSAQDRLIVEQVLADTELTGLAERRFPTLSAGEQAMTMFARVLAQQAPVLLLDEPTAALDVRHQHLVMKLAQRAARGGGATVAVLHDLNLAAGYADLLGVMAGGKMRAFGPPSETLRPGLLTEVYGRRMEVIAHPFTRRPLVIS